MGHRLDQLLRPRSVAVVGATERDGAVGSEVVLNLLAGGFPGALGAVNPARSQVHGLPCVPALRDLDFLPDHVVFAIADDRIEAILESAIEIGVPACTIMSSLVLADDVHPLLRHRVERMVRDAGMLVCGGNCMGFFNFRDRVRISGWSTRAHDHVGNIALISQSGSGMSGIADVDERLDFCFTASSGQELTVGVEAYIDFVLDMPEARVIGLFLETCRRPRELVAVLAKAARQGIPVVAIKTGRSELAARLTVSHSGALAGSDSAFDALFDRYGVQRVDDMDELAAALIMFSRGGVPAAGGLVALHDSGGERQLIIDVAEHTGTALAELSEETCTRLEAELDPGLPAVNPLDGWGAGGALYHRQMQTLFTLLTSDPGAAMGAVVHDRASDGGIHAEYFEYLRAGREATGKPVFLVANRQGTGIDSQVVDATRAGMPVLDGIRQFLVGARCMMAWRDFANQPGEKPPILDGRRADEWSAAFAGLGNATAIEAHRFLKDFGIGVNDATGASSVEEAVMAAERMGYPVVIKTAKPGIHHKTDVGGVVTGIVDRHSLEAAYAEIAARLGPCVTIEPMIEIDQPELLLGVTTDPDFGPLVVVGFGGVHAEILADTASALPPFGPAAARRLVDRLASRRLLDGVRGAQPANIDGFCIMAARLSVIAERFAAHSPEIDLNPVIPGTDGPMALDAMVLMSGIGE